MIEIITERRDDYSHDLLCIITYSGMSYIKDISMFLSFTFVYLFILTPFDMLLIHFV